MQGYEQVYLYLLNAPLALVALVKRELTKGTLKKAGQKPQEKSALRL
jgi:hypothetical protein